MAQIVLIEENSEARAALEQELRAKGYAVLAVASMKEVQSMNGSSASTPTLKLREIERIAIQEYPQTLPNITKATQALFDAVESQQLRLYPAADLREQAVENAVAVETSRGLKLEKARAAKKIDGVVALSMAVTAALDSPPAPTGPMPILVGSRSQVVRLWPYARGLDAAMERSERRGDESSNRPPGLILL